MTMIDRDQQPMTEGRLREIEDAGGLGVDWLVDNIVLDLVDEIRRLGGPAPVTPATRG